MYIRRSQTVQHEDSRRGARHSNVGRRLHGSHRLGEPSTRGHGNQFEAGVWLPERDIARNRNWHARPESPQAADFKTTSVKSAHGNRLIRGPTILSFDVLLGQPSDTSPNAGRLSDRQGNSGGNGRETAVNY